VKRRSDIKAKLAAQLAAQVGGLVAAPNVVVVPPAGAPAAIELSGMSSPYPTAGGTGGMVAAYPAAGAITYPPAGTTYTPAGAAYPPGETALIVFSLLLAPLVTVSLLLFYITSSSYYDLSLFSSLMTCLSSLLLQPILASCNYFASLIISPLFL